MNSVLISVLGIYIFIVLGYVAKRTFKGQIDDRTITLLSVYFLQIFLTLWGLLKHPIDVTLLVAPSIYLVIIFSVLIVSFFLSKLLFKDVKNQSIATIAALIGNTGNLGIPLNIAIFGEASIVYTTIINLMNIFVVYSVGVFIYSRGEFSVRDSLLNIVKLPILWTAIIAIILNLNGYKPNETLDKTLQMGAYASMVMQLVLFGIYLYSAEFKAMSKKLLLWVSSVKFLLLPLFAFSILHFIELDSTIKGILFIELLMPLAVANVNLASLYKCKPVDVTALVFVTSVLFLGVIFLGLEVVKLL